tara:strand:+ start:65 stop:433 length:369 start_codon:yes stop_codon:yes gene_type:complete
MNTLLTSGWGAEALVVVILLIVFIAVSLYAVQPSSVDKTKEFKENIKVLNHQPEKNKYETYHDSISEIINLLNRKKEMMNNGELVDLDSFDKRMTEQMKFLENEQLKLSSLFYRTGFYSFKG